MDFIRWLGNRVQEKAGSTSGPLKIMYRVDGTSDLEEETLDHFEGYMGSSPVRIGNGAADQLQLDIYGEALDSIYIADQRAEPVGHLGWVELSSILNWLSDNWDRPDEGVGDPRRSEGVHLWTAHVLGRLRPRFAHGSRSRSAWRD